MKVLTFLALANVASNLLELQTIFSLITYTPLQLVFSYNFFKMFHILLTSESWVEANS